MKSEVGMRKWEKRTDDRRQRLMKLEVGMRKSEKTTRRAWRIESGQTAEVNEVGSRNAEVGKNNAKGLAHRVRTEDRGQKTEDG